MSVVDRCSGRSCVCWVFRQDVGAGTFFSQQCLTHRMFEFSSHVGGCFIKLVVGPAMRVPACADRRASFACWHSNIEFVCECT
eukprot:9745469-Alexandrium_andersonii.AAC.1